MSLPKPDLRYILSVADSWLVEITKPHSFVTHAKLRDQGPSLVRALVTLLHEKELGKLSGLKSPPPETPGVVKTIKELGSAVPRVKNGMTPSERPKILPPPLPRDELTTSRVPLERPQPVKRDPTLVRGGVPRVIRSPEEQKLVREIGESMLEWIDRVGSLPIIGDDDIESVVFEAPVELKR